MEHANHQPKAVAGRAVTARAVFDHEKLNVYQMELRFLAWVTILIAEVRVNEIAKTREVCDQLDRASLSALLNTAEGNGKRQRPVRAKFFDDARGTATECAACLDALVAKGLTSAARVQRGKQMLLEIVSMLCGLVDRFDTVEGIMREEPVEYGVAKVKLNGVRKRKSLRKREDI